LCGVISTSLTIHGELNNIIVASHYMFTPTKELTWVNVGGGCYTVVSKHGSPFGLDGWCGGHTFMSSACVFLIHVLYLLVAYAWCWSWSQLCRHVKVDGVMLDVSITSIGQLCMLVFSCILYACMHTYVDYAYIDMRIVIMHEVLMCGFYGHALMTRIWLG